VPACAPWQAAPAGLVPAAGVLAPAEPAEVAAEVAAADVEAPGAPVLWAEDVARPPVAWSVAVPHPAAISEAAARPKNRVRMLFRRHNRPSGCACLSPLGVTQAMIKDNSNKHRARALVT
jgi:hypothetical protein